MKPPLHPISLSAKNLKMMSLEMGFNGSRFHGKKTMDEDVLLKGSWSYQTQLQGLSMHCGHFREMEDTTISIELPPGLSFNIILDGQISFALAGERHTVGKQTHPPVCACFTLDSNEILTRHLSKDQEVYKINIFIEKDWLLQRFREHDDTTQLGKLFEHHARLHTWTASQHMIKLSHKLLQTRPGTTIGEHLNFEAHIIKLLSSCIDDLIEHAAHATRHTQTANTVDESRICVRCKNYIDENELSKLSLVQIAQALNVSISTLQRQFKKTYGMTVIDYLRHHRLDRARAALAKDRLSIGEAAYIAGYNHPSNFIAAFKKRFSISPSDYRKKHAQPFGH